MLELSLRDAIRKFVKTFGVIHRRHLNNFFVDDWGTLSCKRVIIDMLDVKELYQFSGDILSFCHPDQMHCSVRDFDDILKCLDMFTNVLKSSDVTWFDIADFPLSIRFLTVADEMYDVTYLDNRNWINKVALLPIAWKKCVPAGQKDPFNHIAVVPSLDVAQKVRELAFTQFVVIDRDGTVQGIYDN